LKGEEIVSNKILPSLTLLLFSPLYCTGIILYCRGRSYVGQCECLYVLGSCQNYQNGALMAVLIACDPCGNSARGMYWLDLFTYIFISAMCTCTNL
jgi:hypothetical protein